MSIQSSTSNNHWKGILLALIFALWSWLAMQAVHELGHVIFAWLSGGTVQRVILHPLAISQTIVDPNPFPRAVVWSGPLLGVLIPVLCWVVVRFFRAPSEWFFRLFAGFCLIANGAYIGIGLWDPVGDALVMRQLETPPWRMAVFGGCCLISGIALWDGIGQEFGWGKNGKRVTWKCIAMVTTLLVVTVIAELVYHSYVNSQS